MDHRTFLILWWFAVGRCLGEKLSPDQKAPLFARGSGGLILAPPFEGQKTQGASAPPVPDDGSVQREEKESYKIVDGQVVRVVEGSFSYKSPEGLAVAVRYTADENGNRASFRLGAAASSGAAAGPRPGPRPGTRPGTRPGAGTTGKTSTSPDNDRSYLPPN